MWCLWRLWRPIDRPRHHVVDWLESDDGGIVRELALWKKTDGVHRSSAVEGVRR